MEKCTQEVLSTSLRNKEFYDKVAGIYRYADGRRNNKKPEKIIAYLQKETDGYTFLDLGSGDGYIANIAIKYFRWVYAYDISEKMLEKIINPLIQKRVGPAEKLNFPLLSFDVICAYSLFHHLADYRPVIDEIYRVLMPKGIFYLDGDITQTFYNRFKWGIELYRKFRQAHKRFGVSKEEFDSVEVGQKGIDDRGIIAYLKEKHFRVEVLRTMPMLRLLARKI